MPTVPLQRSIRDQALDVVETRLRYRPADQTPLADLGNVTAVALLIDLEQAFGILLDVDEALPHGTVGELLALVTLRTCCREPRAAAAEPFALIDLAAYRAERTRRRERPFVIPEADTPPPVGEVSAQLTEGVSPPAPAAPDPRLETFRRETSTGAFFGILAAICVAAGFICGLIFFALEPR